VSLRARILDEKRRLIYPVVAVLILDVALYLAVIYPLSTKVTANEQSAQAAASAAAAARREYEAARNTVSGKAAADAELKKFYGDVLPPDLSAAQRVTYLKIHQLAQKSNVTYERASNDVTRESGSALGRLSTTVTLSGQYRDIRNFIHQLETAPEFLILETVSLSQGAEKSAALAVTVKVSIYYQAGANGS
jgi:Tfp pilus assembly protein PilO